MTHADETGVGAVNGRAELFSGAAHIERTDWLWISWNQHRRTTGLCEAWGVPLVVLPARHEGLLKWLELTAGTVRLLRDRRPAVLLVQCPSVALSTVAAICRRVFGYYLVVDAHNEAVRPFDRPYAFVRWLSNRLLNAAGTVIVSNDALAKDVTLAGGRPVVLPDRMPQPPATARSVETGANEPDVVVIATYRRDEPIDAIVAAASKLPDVRFSFTGSAERYAHDDTGLPGNVCLMGYLDDDQYWNVLARSRVICDLTLKPDCLVCGAYEALAQGKPMVLSDNRPTREIFGKVAILTDAEPANIADAIRLALEQQGELEANVRELRQSYPVQWQLQANRALDHIQAGSKSATGEGH